MAEFKGTKGVWDTHKDDGVHLVIEGKVGRFQEYTPVFECKQNGDRAYRDAKLASAAPDLLIALQELLFERFCISADASSITEVINAQKAIKEAIGE